MVPNSRYSHFSPTGKTLDFRKIFKFRALVARQGCIFRKSCLSEGTPGKSPLSNETTSSPVALLEKVDTLLQKLKTWFLAVFGPILGILTLILIVSPNVSGGFHRRSHRVLSPCQILARSEHAVKFLASSL